MFKRNQKGFTLIELMIVIAIIGILAAIAVPQFLSYRMRSYNTTGKACAHQLMNDEGNLNAELKEYGHTEAAGALLNAADGGSAPADSNSATGDFTLRRPSDMANPGARLVGTHSVTGMQIAIGIAIGDSMTAWADNLGANPDSYVIMARHYESDTAYGCDSDISNQMYQVSNPAWAGDVAGGLLATAVAPTVSFDDFNGAAGGGDPTLNWTAGL